MELIISKVVSFLVCLGAAAIAALILEFIAHSSYGLSRLDLQTSALAGAAIIAVLLATELLRKSK